MSDEQNMHDADQNSIGRESSEPAEISSLNEEKANNGLSEPFPAAEPPRAESLFEHVYGVLFTPAAALRQIAQQRPLGQAVFVFLFSQVLAAIAAVVTSNRDLPPQLAPYLPGFVLLFSLCGGAAGWFFSTAMFHLLAEFFGGRGRGYTLFVVLGFTGLPVLLLAPASFLAGGPLAWVHTLLTLAVYIWSGVLMVIAIREVHGISTGRAVLTLLIPPLSFLAFLLVFTVFMVILIAAVAPSMPGFPPFPGL